MGKGRMMSLSFLLSIVHTPLWWVLPVSPISPLLKSLNCKSLKENKKERHILCVWPQVGVSQDFNVIGNPGNVAREIPSNPGIQIYRSMDAHFFIAILWKWTPPELRRNVAINIVGGSTFMFRWQTGKHSFNLNIEEKNCWAICWHEFSSSDFFENGNPSSASHLSLPFLLHNQHAHLQVIIQAIKVTKQ